MAYDDIATSALNTVPGKMFNEPNGQNVYDYDSIDYRGDDVNLDTFTHVMTGDKRLFDGPVLESNKDSKVFLFYADHGAPGFVQFPKGDSLYADQL